MPSGFLADFVHSTDIIPAIKTDHAAISLALGEVGEVKGPGMWKMSVLVLDGEDYLDYLKVNIPKWQSEGEKEMSDKRSVCLGLDKIQYKIARYQLSKDKAKQRNDKERQLQQEYKEATKLFEDDPNHINNSRLDEVKEKLGLFYEEKTKGIIIRARARWHEHGEKVPNIF